MTSRSPQRRFAPLIVALLGGCAIELQAADVEVAASIHVPSAEAYVLGDDIPLVWRFTNLSPDPLAMLWEGCCRLNGNLAITANGQSVEVLPPGASSFHRFSKAETLPPGKPMEFSSLLSDWVRLPAGGELDIGGRYTGVLTNQKPQVPAGLALWTGTAATTPTRLKILGVDDYLAQHAARSRERGLELELTGPDRLPPLAPTTFTVTMRNPGDTPKIVNWPGTFQLWLVDERGWRLEKVTKHLPLGGEHLTIPAHSELRRAFQLSSADLSGEPFGTLKVFLDLGAATREEKRLPSTAVSVAWNLSPADTTALLNEAASGPAAGLRNPALKLLRQYLDALQPSLRNPQDDLLINQRARTLRDELILAGCVQPLHPKPGDVFLPLFPNEPGAWFVALPDSECAAIAATDALSQVKQIVGVRRHLGWDITVEAKPAISTSLKELFTLARALDPQREQLAAPLTWRLPQTGGLATNHVQFPSELPDANIIVRLRAADGRTKIEAARKPAQLNRPAQMNSLTANEVRQLPGTSLADSVALRDWLAANPGVPQPLVVAEDGVSCGDFLRLLQPLVDASLRIAIISPRTLQ